MTSIDELFKGVASSSGKRKFDARTRDASEVYKAAKLERNGHARTSAQQPSVDDQTDLDDGGAEGEEAGPALPPGDNEPEEDDGEDGGRFFGGGVDRDTADMIDYVNDRDDGALSAEKIDSAWLRRLALGLEKKISKNAELRSKFEDDASKFMASEGDLDADIKGLSVLTEHSEYYQEFAKLGCVGSVVSLLAHENTDIAIDAVQILAELTDEDVEAEQEQWDALVEAMLEADIASLLVSNLERLDETNEEDREGVYHSLSLLENLSSQIKASEDIVKGSKVLSWLLERIKRRELPTTQNKQYAAEVLAIVLQSSSTNRASALNLDAVDTFLQLLAAYRRRDPAKDSEEEEYAENMFDCLTCMVDDVDGKAKFIEAEGIELCLMMLKEGKFSKSRALRVLDHAVGGIDGAGMCVKLVDAAGLRTLFSMFHKQSDRQNIEHLIGIFSSLLRLLPGESSARIRTLAKFLEKDYEKIDKIVRLREEYAQRLQPIEDAITQERQNLSAEEQEDVEDEWLSRRLEAGLFSFQTIDVILAWLVAEDGGAKSHISTALARQQRSLHDTRRTLEEQSKGLEGVDSEEATLNGEMLRTLITFLD